MTLAERYERLRTTPTAINEHLEILRGYAAGCQSVAEFGVDTGQSTTAFLMALPQRLHSYDLVMHPDLLEINQAFGAESLPRLEMGEGFTLFVWDGDKKGLWHFHLDDSRTCTIPEVDLLFIDSAHSYEQMRTELARHAGQVRKWIICHDTVSFGEFSEAGPPHVGILPAITEFLAANPAWRESAHYDYNNGLLVMERTDG